MSRTSRPKQFIDILGTGKTLIQQTFDRFLKICPVENIFIVTNEIYKEMVMKQLDGITSEQVLCEPMRRNTAPAIAFAAYKIKKLNPDALLIVAPSDHIILQEDVFTDVILSTLNAASKNEWLLTLGITPSRPDTGYGYIQFYWYLLVQSSCHSLLKPTDVVIPFAGQISNYLQRGERLPIAARRAFNRSMAIIQTVVCAYQFQRTRDDKGRLQAEMSDYWMALQIVREAFRETLGHQSKEAALRIEFIRKNGPVQYGTLTSEWGISKSALTSWVRGKLIDGILTWCDDDGKEFPDEAALKKAKHSGRAYLKINDAFNADDVTGLPTPFELTGDPRWNEGGDLYRLYDLRLDQRQMIENTGSDEVSAHELTDDGPDETAGEAEPAFSFDDCIF